MSWLWERVDTSWQWAADHAALGGAMFVVSLVVLVGSLWICHRVLTTVPADYFQSKHKPFEQWRKTRPVLWWTLMIGKNLAGALLILLGLIMFFTPGQGILTLLLGVALVDAPGKQRVIRQIVQRKSVYTVINRLRARANQPPLELS